MVELGTATAPASPQRTSAALARSLNAGDVAAATACFAKDACLLTPDATAIRSREEIRPILAQLVARQTRIEVLLSSVLHAGELALCAEDWLIRSAAPDGATFEQRSRPTLVLRRLEGEWKLAIAAPWGWAR